MASTYLSRTPSGAGNRKTYTFSLWFKRANLSEQVIFNSTGGGIGEIRLNLLNDDLKFRDAQSGITKFEYITDRKFRDTSGWYHLVIAVDTTQATASDRVKFYINGVEETSFSTETNPDQNYDTTWNTADIFQIASNQNPGDYFDGLMSHFHFIDGTAYDADTFGETDATTGIWKPKLSPSVTYGTNGFFLKFNEGALGTDSSPNGNNFTVNGSLTPTKDTPENNFATWNPVSNPRISSGTVYLPTFSNGNTTVNQADVNYYTGTKSSIGVNAGKWYLEAKCSAVGSQAYIGLAPDDDYGELSITYFYENNGQINSSAYGNTYTAGDILQIAFDADNGTVWFGKNGTWENSATQSEIENGTTTNAGITGLSMTKFYHFATKGYNGATFQANFGNGYFGTTAVASAGSNGNDAIFEYDVPTGYYALNTTNLATYG